MFIAEIDNAFENSLITLSIFFLLCLSKSRFDLAIDRFLVLFKLNYDTPFLNCANDKIYQKISESY